MRLIDADALYNGAMKEEYVALYCNPLHEPEKVPESRCLDDDMNAVEYLAKGILADFMELKKRMV